MRNIVNIVTVLAAAAVSLSGTADAAPFDVRVAAAEGDATAAIQRAIDDCFRAGGGVVRVAGGEHRVKSLRLRSRVELHLERDARIVASRNPSDYDGLIAGDAIEPFGEKPLDPGDRLSIASTNHWNNAIIRIYRAHDVAITGEPGSEIDGRNCYDANGEEKYRGPHGIATHFSSNILCRGYTIRDTGNWSHRFCLSSDIRVENVAIRGGHDGLDFHACDRVLVDGCDIRTGDDCVAGYDNEGMTVRRCRLNSACSDFRIGGRGILVEDVEAWGPAESAHRYSLPLEDLVAGRNPPEAGRRNTLSFFTFYGNRRTRRSPGDIVFRNCRVSGVDKFMHYNFSGNERWQTGEPLSCVTFENVVVDGLKEPSVSYGTAQVPLAMTMRKCSFSFGGKASELFRGAYVGRVEIDGLEVRGVEGPLFRMWSDGPDVSVGESGLDLPVFASGAGDFAAKPI